MTTLAKIIERNVIERPFFKAINEYLAPKDPLLVYYGPHPCRECKKPICRTSEAQGRPLEFDYPEGPIYPNTHWDKHICEEKKS